ncbi:anhydro-N-acetylmuramic acid kinase [Aurantibacter crassamenti]|uniref:anhydro-N-acetylmuramic acid kinase n=1 Tax=Aurantibacter crassamenti TaxID=1837375 RepID=UPI00193A0286|nr:anhydro-N-acetylmuramic acid kinase [Aurantibacter crassamenti]MBM1106717.1 anhydro-N-acetylmuramic acid kinase [Aurantibacter crassamenti]
MKTYNILGLMSGTSLDGLDLAYCTIWQTQSSWKFDIKKTKSVSYTQEMEDALKNSIYLSAADLLIFHNHYGTWLGEQAKKFIEENNLTIDAIASHGHTTHHQPENGLTFQIGSGQHLANASGQTVICDFRTNDVALGGQGAPLVPIGDKLFFGQYDFCLNLGGISNVSFEKNEKRIAYDIGLANMILNYITRKHDLAYDDGGLLAKSGVLNNKMLDSLNALEYYKLPIPKSIGYEWFVEKVVPIVDRTEDSMSNLLHTSIHHICDQVAIQIKKHCSSQNNTLLITGGGALNTFLIDTLQKKLGDSVKIIKTSSELIEFKEALVFALMGVLRIENEINVLNSVTGAATNSSSGVIYLPA